MQSISPNQKNLPRALSVLSAAAVISISCSVANAALLVVNTPAGATTGGQPVSAKATITTGVNQVTVLLENLQADPRSVTQAISGFQFHINSGQTSGTLASSSGVERIVNGDGAFVNGGSASTGWSLATVGSDLKLNLLQTPAAPDHTIIGPPGAGNLYSNANPSITNGIHSPFFALSATFTLNVPGVTAASTISDTLFQFNTSPGNTVPGADVPEPVTGALIGATFLAALSMRRRREF